MHVSTVDILVDACFKKQVSMMRFSTLWGAHCRLTVVICWINLS